MQPEYKSRLRGRGDLEGIHGSRTDSPTSDVEAHPLERKLLLRLPDPEYEDGRTMILANVPIFGSHDSCWMF